RLIVVDETVTVEREGKVMDIPMPVVLIGTLVEKRKRSEGPMISPRTTVIVMNLPDTGTAFKAGLRKSDQIVAINGDSTLFYDEFDHVMVDRKAGERVTLTVSRQDSLLQIPMTLVYDGKIGFNAPAMPQQFDSLGFYK